jgi:tetratricopeptide (TPR) repeat protein
MNSAFKIPLRIIGLTGMLLLAVACSSSEERASDYYKRGMELMEKGEFVKAGLDFRNALKLDEKRVDARFALGEVEEKLGNFETAARIFLSVTEWDKEHVDARTRLAYILLAGGDLESAKKYSDEAAAIAGDAVSVKILQSALALKKDNRGDAVSLAQEVLQKEPANADALIILAAERLASADPAGALQFLEEGAKADEKNVGLQLMRLRALDALNDQPGVEALFSRLFVLFPDVPEFRDALARWYLAKGRGADAEKVLRDFAAANPDDERAQFTLVGFLNSQKGMPAAIEALQGLADKSPDVFVGSPLAFRMALAELKFASNDSDAAVAEMRQIAEKTSGVDRNKANVQLAKMLVTQGQSAEARTLVDAIIASDTKNVDALSVRAALRLSDNKNSEAVDDLLIAINEAPESPLLVLMLAEAYEKNGSISLAEEQYAKSARIDRGATGSSIRLAQFYLRYGKSEQATRALEEARTRDPNDRAVLTQLASLKLRAGDWSGAQELAEALRRLDAGKPSVEADQIAAAALGGLGRSDESIAILQSTRPDPARRNAVLADLVRAYLRSGKIDEAEKLVQETIASEPGNVGAQLLLASVYAAGKKPELAEQTLKTIVETDKESVVGFTALAQYYLSVDRKADAEATAAAGLVRDPNADALRLLLAQILERAEKYDAAIAEYETLYAKNQSSTVVANNLASLLSERRGDPTSLERAAAIAVRFSTAETPEFLDTSGWIYFLQKDYAQALPLLRTAAERLPNLGLVQYHLGMVLKELNQADAAKAALEKALTLAPSLSAADIEKVKLALAQVGTTKAN